uniref:Protein kinase putative n=1 Tax=Albugo laibachii Nc14 TaxID=890382 RepID=F0WLA4_9STRA|nr:protein kinase putative [Albugo laibachii Nc14]|eukprot:CCA22066.1 protein kinase putative [Albugo laibachii Nc14]
MQAPSVRVCIQLAQLNRNQVVYSDVKIAFVTTMDAWLVTVNELVMSCFEDDIEIEERPDGLLEQCRILQASSYDLITESSQFRDGQCYIVCLDRSIFDRIWKRCGKTPRTEERLCKDDDGNANCIQLTDRMECLKELSYYFDPYGILRCCVSNQAIFELVASQQEDRRAMDAMDAMDAAISHIEMDLMAELDFKRAHIRMQVKADPCKSVHGKTKQVICDLFITSDWKTRPNLLIVINGSEDARPGIWSTDALIFEGLELGSMLPTLRRAREQHFAIAILDPYKRDGKTDRRIVSPEEYILLVCDKILCTFGAKQCFILAQADAIDLVILLATERKQSLCQKLKAVVFAEAPFSSLVTLSENHSFAWKLAMNFTSDAVVPTGEHVDGPGSNCVSISVGDLSSIVCNNRRKRAASILHASSKQAITISIALDVIFTYFVAARDREISAREFTWECDRGTTSWLRHLMQCRLDAIDLIRQSRRNRMFSATDTDCERNNRLASITELRNTMIDTSTSSVCSSFQIECCNLNLANSTKNPSSEDGTLRHTLNAISISDFDLIKVIGRGSIGKVFLARKIDTQKLCAIKVLRKELVQLNMKEYVKTERYILKEIEHPLISRLRFSFQTKDKLYLVTDYCSGGELFHHMSEVGFSYNLARFYCAELVLALEHLHHLNVAYRDLKPENILLQSTGHICVTDFGLSKLNVFSNEGASTIVGSPEYLAPEVYSMQKYGHVVDWWSLGVLMFEMLTGSHPFLDANHDLKVKRIMTPGIIQQLFPANMNEDARDLINRLLTFEPTERLGAHGADDIKTHSFFSTITWDLVFLQEVQPPWKPTVHDELDVGNFDPEFTSEPAIDTIRAGHPFSSRQSGTFENFTFYPRTIKSKSSA